MMQLLNRGLGVNSKEDIMGMHYKLHQHQENPEKLNLT